MKCDVCDEEFDNENQLMQHKAQMHAGGESGGMQGESMKGGGDGLDRDDDLEEPDMQRAANE